jgi:hypothetical protein
MYSRCWYAWALMPWVLLSTPSACDAMCSNLHSPFEAGPGALPGMVTLTVCTSSNVVWP